MRKGKFIRKIAMLISLVILITSTVNTTYGFVVASTDSVINIFVPEEVEISGLTLDKSIEHSLGEGYRIPDGISFDFKIELGSYYANAKLTTTAGDVTADASGTLHVTVKPGVRLGIEGVKAGTTVKVTEQPTSFAGFAVKGEKNKTVTVGADGVAAVSFVNTYTPAAVKPENVTVSGIKVLEGREWKEGDSFTFRLEQLSESVWTECGTTSVTYNPENTDFNRFDFSEVLKNVTFDKTGIYQFRVTEIQGDLEHMDYDKTVKTFSVTVTDRDMDGKLEIGAVTGSENAAVTSSNGVYGVFLTFNNVFVPPVLPDPDPIRVTVDVNKTVSNTGSLQLGPSGFEFALENTATAEKQSQISNAQGKAVFSLSYTKDDVGNTYSYKLYEVSKGLAGMTYDETVYEVKVAVSLTQENVLIADVTLNGESVDAVTVEFQNVYHANRPDSPSTGDKSNVTFWFVMMIISGSVFVSLLIYDRKKIKA